jgi:hypothetical protein
VRFLPGIAAALVAAFAIAWTIRGRDGADDPRPPDSFLDTEVALGDVDSTGSCYSLRVVLTQGQFWLPNATSLWRELNPGEWSFRVEWLDSDAPGAASQWREFDFVERAGLIEPLEVRRPEADDAADNPVPAPALEAEFAEWVGAARERAAGKVDRCRQKTGPDTDS